MNLGSCNFSVIPLRASNNHRSEMVSQLLFAEQFEICHQEKEWAYIRMLDIGYEGWLQQGQFVRLPKDHLMTISEANYLVVDIKGGKAFSNDIEIDLLPGTRIPKQLLQRQYSDFCYQIEGHLHEPSLKNFETEFRKLINYYHNSPYLWGGRTHFGIDCSGLSQAIYSHFGTILPRDAYQQAAQGQVIHSLSEIKSGDLAFFDNEEGRITHVGIMLNSDTIFHASTHVRIDKMDMKGIFNKEQNCYTHKLCIVKRLG